MQKPATTQEQKPILSIVIPAYNEEGNIEKIYHDLSEILLEIDISYEIIFVDDGSNDRTWEVISSLQQKDSLIKGLRLSRNFGHQYALFAGLSHAIGKAVISMDADLQHPPRLIPELISKWHEGNKIVHTVRADPEDFGFLKKKMSRLYYKIFSFCSGIKIEPGMADFRLLDRDVVNSVLLFREEGLFVRGIVQWVGYPSAFVHFQSANRYSGSSHYTLKKMVRLAWNGIASFSIVPLRISTVVGLLMGCFALLVIGYAVYAKYVLQEVVTGWTSLIAVVSVLFGILFILIGIIGEYIGRILLEVRQRPRFLISDRAGVTSSDDRNSEMTIDP